MEKKILVADDSLTIQKVVELTFADSDYRLTCVSNGRLALEKVREERPDLILADVVMPEKNGYEVCEEIKKNPETAGIPVVLLAGTFEPFDRERAQALGCDAIVSKPFDSRELYRKVEALVAGQPGASAAEGKSLLPETGPAPPAAPAESVAAPSPFPATPPNPFDAGFVEEDFTGSIRTLRAGHGEPLANLYGPEDVDSALAAFREVEPTSSTGAPAGSISRPSGSLEPRPTGDTFARRADEGGEAEEVSEPPEPAGVSASDDGRTQRIDVAEFRPPRAATPRSESTMEVLRAPAAEPEPPQRTPIEFVEPLPPLPVDQTGDVAAAVADAANPPGRVSAPVVSFRDLTDADVERLADRVAAKLVEKLSDRIVREVAWEVVPETAELVVRERLKELESGVE